MATGGPHDRSPVGTPGGRQNWVDKVGGLPGYIREIAHALIRQGHSESAAIRIAIGTVQRWARGQGNVSAATRAKAAAALAEWEAKKAASHARSGSVRLSRPPGGSVTQTVDLAPTQAKRDRARKAGHALPDGSFPIENRSDLVKAIGLAGNAKDPAKARAFICKRAKALGLDNLIPKTWSHVGDYSAPVPDEPIDLAAGGAKWSHGWVPLNDAAKKIAKARKAAGLGPGGSRPDGSEGATSADPKVAIRTFQERYGLPVTGKLDPATRRKAATVASSHKGQRHFRRATAIDALAHGKRRKAQRVLNRRASGNAARLAKSKKVSLSTLTARADSVQDPAQRRAARSAILDLAPRWRHGWIPLNAEAVAIASRGGPHGQKSRVAGRTKMGAVKQRTGRSPGQARTFAEMKGSPEAKAYAAQSRPSPNDQVKAANAELERIMPRKQSASQEAYQAGIRKGPSLIEQMTDEALRGAARGSSHRDQHVRNVAALAQAELARRTNTGGPVKSTTQKVTERGAERRRQLNTRGFSGNDKPGSAAANAAAHPNDRPNSARQLTGAQNYQDFKSMTAAQKIDAAARMHGTGSKQHEEAIRRFGGPEKPSIGSSMARANSARIEQTRAMKKSASSKKVKPHHQPGAQVKFKTKGGGVHAGDVVRPVEGSSTHLLVKDGSGTIHHVHKSYVQPAGSGVTSRNDAANAEIEAGKNATPPAATGIDKETGMFASRLAESRRALQANMARNPRMAETIKRRYTNALARVKELEAKRQKSGFWTASDARALQNAKRAVAEGGKI